MIGPISKKTLFAYVMINLGTSAIFVLLIWYTSRFLEGTLHYIQLILGAPSYFILLLLKGPTNVMHFTSENTFRLVSFVFYSFVVGLIQIIILKWRNKKEATDKRLQGQ
jgi:hypothetical protein